MYKVIVFLAMCSFFQSGWSQTYTGPEKDLKIIKENIQKFSRYVMASDYEMIGNSYSADAKILVTGRDIIEGSTIGKAYWKSVYHMEPTF